MTNKEQLQKEILEKIKPGTKPSDLKKQKVKNIKDEGYSSEEEKSIPKAPTTPNQKIKDLETQISSLKKQLQTYKDFKEADLKIKEKYKQKISDLENTIHDLDYLLKTGKNSDIIKKLQTKIAEQDKTIEGLKKQANNKKEVKEATNKTFFCDSCQLTKTGIYIKRKADAPFEPRLHGRTVYLCSPCSPYVKELSEVDYDKENNPYKVE